MHPGQKTPIQPQQQFNPMPYQLNNNMMMKNPNGYNNFNPMNPMNNSKNGTIVGNKNINGNLNTYMMNGGIMNTNMNMNGIMN